MTVPGSVLVRSVPALSPRQYEALWTYGHTADQLAAARIMGISYETYTNHASAAYRRLGVTGAVGAFRVLGWLVLPELRREAA